MCRCVQLVLCHICFLSVTQRNLDVSMYHRTMGVGEHILVRSVRISRGEKRQIYQGAQRGGHIEPQGIGGVAQMLCPLCMWSFWLGHSGYPPP